MRQPNRQPVGVPSLLAPEKLASWRIDQIARRKRFALPGGIVRTEIADIPTMIATAVIKMGSREALSLHFQQTSKTAHIQVAEELGVLRSKGALAGLGLTVHSDRTVGALIDRTGKREDGKLGRVELRFRVGIEGRSRPCSLTPIKAEIFGRTVERSVRFRPIRHGSLFGPASLLPPLFCINFFCHSDWTWFPGVPATTTCHGGCYLGGTACQCWVTGVSPPAKAGICAGFKACWC